MRYDLIRTLGCRTGTMARSEDRHTLTTRLVACCRSLIVASSSLLAISFWVLQVVAAREVPGDGREQPPAELALRAPRGVLFDRNGRVLVENRPSFNISIVREHTEGSRSHHPRAGGGRRRRRAAASARSSTATGASRRYRPIVVDRGRDRSRRSRPSRRGGSTSSCRTSSCSRCRRGSIPTEELGGAPVRLRRRGQRRAGGRRRRA